MGKARIQLRQPTTHERNQLEDLATSPYADPWVARRAMFLLTVLNNPETPVTRIIERQGFHKKITTWIYLFNEKGMKPILTVRGKTDRTNVRRGTRRKWPVATPVVAAPAPTVTPVRKQEPTVFQFETKRANGVASSEIPIFAPFALPVQSENIALFVCHRVYSWDGALIVAAKNIGNAAEIFKKSEGFYPLSIQQLEGVRATDGLERVVYDHYPEGHRVAA